MTEERAIAIINNLIIDLLDKADFPEDQIVDYLTEEIGMTAEEVKSLNEINRRGLV